jgi:hypothetical protein
MDSYEIRWSADVTGRREMWVYRKNWVRVKGVVMYPRRKRDTADS